MHVIPALPLNPTLTFESRRTDTHALTYAQRCEVQQIACGVARHARDAQVGQVNGPQLVLVVVQSAPTAGGPR